MKKYLINSALLIMTLIVGLIYGIVIHKHKVFPYGIINIAYHYLIPKEPGIAYSESILDCEPSWSIGIYEGSTPFDLAAPEDISNPVLTGKDVVDIDALFVADPFMVLKNDKYYMFFEVYNRETNQGDISYAESPDGKHWEYRKVIIDETFHLSYPYVFEWADDYYLIPESSQDSSVRLYKAVSFPDKWEYVGNLMTGYRYVDPSIFRHNDKWWLFVNTPSNWKPHSTNPIVTSGSNDLNLYYSSDLLGGWKPHPMNPIVKSDKNIARMGGRVITHNDRLYRLTQDDYHIRIFAFAITELTEKSYVEKIVSEKPVVNMTGKGWNASGMHHVDLHKIGDKWIAVVDGRNIQDSQSATLHSGR